MADLLLDLLDAERTDPEAHSSRANNPAALTIKLQYLDHLAEQSQASLLSAEPQSLAHSSHSLLLSLQDISKRSHKTVVDSASRHATLGRALPRLMKGTTQLQNAIPKVDSEALHFSSTYSKASDNNNLLRRRRALLLLDNVEPVPPNYATALDLNGHIRRLHLLHPESPLIASVYRQASEAIDRLTADLVATLKAPGLKLATALRTAV
ncbi:hypothetical protein HYQ46_012054 [Verticillium longisporum]|nr:hypothetical protein HYQ46_012054 [Verticillium longisporum]